MGEEGEGGGGGDEIVDSREGVTQILRKSESQESYLR